MDYGWWRSSSQLSTVPRNIVPGGNRDDRNNDAGVPLEVVFSPSLPVFLFHQQTLLSQLSISPSTRY